jgi:hypothetical protein
VKYLIENGADIHADDDYALVFAVSYGHLDVVKYLIEGPEDAEDDKRPWDEGCKLLVPWHPANINILKNFRSKKIQKLLKTCQKKTIVKKDTTCKSTTKKVLKYKKISAKNSEYCHIYQTKKSK